MLAKEFDEILEKRLAKTRALLKSKAGDYAMEHDRLHNFQKASELGGRTPAQCLQGFALKHWVSLSDQIDKAAQREVNLARVDEVIGDVIAYLCLLEAIFIEQARA